MRYEPADILKAICLFLMPIDHFRDFFSNTVIVANDMLNMPIGLYLFRSLSICGALAFNFTAGMSIAFVMSKSNFAESGRLTLPKRDLILVALDIILDYPLFWGKFGISFSALSSLGIAMIVLAIIIPYREKFVACLAAGITIFYNFLPFFPKLDA